MDEQAERGTSGIDRRSLLKKAAIGGAVVWVAPTVLTSTAHAQGSGTAIIGGFVDPDTEVELHSFGGSGAGRAIEPLVATTTSDQTGEYGFDVAPGYDYSIFATCETSFAYIGSVNDAQPGLVYGISCFVGD